MIAHDAVLRRVGATLPNSSAKQEGAGLHWHMPIRIDGAGNRDLVEQVKEVEMLIEHDRGAEDSIGIGFFESLDRVI